MHSPRAAVDGLDQVWAPVSEPDGIAAVEPELTAMPRSAPWNWTRFGVPVESTISLSFQFRAGLLVWVSFEQSG